MVNRFVEKIFEEKSPAVSIFDFEQANASWVSIIFGGVKLIYLLGILNQRFLFSDLGGSIIYSKGKLVACVTASESGYWWGCTHTNRWIYAPTIDSTIINYGKTDCKHEVLCIPHRNTF